VSKHFSLGTGNAEVTIDVPGKTVSFVPAGRNVNPNLGYFINRYYIFLGLFVGGVYSLVWMTLYKAVLPLEVLVSCLVVLGLMSFWLVFFASLSVFIHNRSSLARKNVGYTNSFLVVKKRRSVVFEDLQKPFFPGGLIMGHTVVVYDYDVVKFEYSYVGENELLRVETKSVEPPGHKGEHYRFIALFTFKAPLTEGLLSWR
jgi:hypothetical protein